MVKRYKGRAWARAAIFAASAALCLASCKGQVSGRAEMLSGASAWHSQQWDKAIASFLPLSASPNAAISDYAAYGLAVAYIEQNELKAAKSRLSDIEATPFESLRAAVWYEKGVCEYLEGNYSEAALCFRRSLEIEPSRADAKVNLELSLMRAGDEEANASAFSSLQSAAAESESAAEESAVFSLIERKEIERWKKLAETVRETPAPDY